MCMSYHVVYAFLFFEIVVHYSILVLQERCGFRDILDICHGYIFPGGSPASYNTNIS